MPPAEGGGMEINMIDTKAFIMAYFTELEKQEIKYCILRNVDEIISGNAHDIDFTVDVKKLKKAVSLMKQVAINYGWTLHFYSGDINDNKNIKCLHFYQCDDSNKKIVIAHFDIFPVFNWEGFELLTNSDLLHNRMLYEGVYKASDAVESVTKLFIRLLHTGKVKDKYKPAIKSVFTADHDAVIRIMEEFLSHESARIVAEKVIYEQWDEIEGYREKLIVDIKTKAKKNLRVKYLLSKIINRTGVMIAFEGTDGSGKSTIIDRLTDILSNSFPQGMLDCYHWRPGFIKKETKIKDGKVVIVTDPHAKKPYGRLKSFAKFMFFNMDYILGYWMRVRIQLAKGHLVIFDRYYYDYYLDKLRYRLKISDRTLNLFKVLIPKPDITFLLIGDAKTLYERKKEISIEEIEEQLQRIQFCEKWFNNACAIDVNQDIDTVSYIVAKKILEIGGKRYECYNAGKKTRQ